MIISLGFHVFVLCWNWFTPTLAEGERQTKKIDWLVEDTNECEPKDLKDAHKVLPKWLPYEPTNRQFSQLLKGITKQGRNYAGRTEFPWLVDLREIPTEDWSSIENWANGNLITGKFVLTTCEAVAIFKKAPQGGNAFQKDLGSPNWFLEKKDPIDYVVMFASRYPYVARPYNTKDEVGTREVRSFWPHPKCNYFVLDYSLGTVEINGPPIWPFPPFTTYMHMDFDCAGFQRAKTHFNYPWIKITDEEYCDVGLWNRKVSRDDKFFLLEFDKSPSKLRQYTQLYHHKVKYPVRFIDPKFCKNNIEFFPERMHLQDMNYFECMALNGSVPVGVVCNRDRGAPIVCNGTVRAIVLSGATEEHCENTNPMPFLVIDARFMYTMWTNLNAFALKNTTGQKPSPFSGIHRSYSSRNLVLLLLLCFSLIYSLS